MKKTNDKREYSSDQLQTSRVDGTYDYRNTHTHSLYYQYIIHEPEQNRQKLSVQKPHSTPE